MLTNECRLLERSVFVWRARVRDCVGGAKRWCHHKHEGEKTHILQRRSGPVLICNSTISGMSRKQTACRLETWRLCRPISMTGQCTSFIFGEFSSPSFLHPLLFLFLFSFPLKSTYFSHVSVLTHPPGPSKTRCMPAAAISCVRISASTIHMVATTAKRSMVSSKQSSAFRAGWSVTGELCTLELLLFWQVLML
jgi:hypothetical protein